eukprot:gene12715-12845_t
MLEALKQQRQLPINSQTTQLQPLPGQSSVAQCSAVRSTAQGAATSAAAAGVSAAESDPSNWQADDADVAGSCGLAGTEDLVELILKQQQAALAGGRRSAATAGNAGAGLNDNAPAIINAAAAAALDELDQLFDDTGAAAAAAACSPSQRARGPTLQPATLASLVAGSAAAARSAAALLAALQAAAVPPRQLVTDIRGSSITVTGCGSDQRVYCQLAAARPTEQQHGRQQQGYVDSSSSSGGISELLVRPLGDLLDELAARRRQGAIPAGGCAGRGPTAGAGSSKAPGSAGGDISRAFDAARYQAAQAARAAAKILLIVGPPVSRRPPLIVLDELDGAAGGAEGHSAVAALVKLVSSTCSGDSCGGPSSRKRRRAAGRASAGLGVPVIATANDAFAACLRPLRDLAAVYHFKPLAPDKLGARLAAIAAAEGLMVERQAVALLIERSGCDVRTAINTLQLLARQQCKQWLPSAAAASSAGGTLHQGPRVRITAAAVSSSGALGLKDVSLTALGVLNELVAGANRCGALSRPSCAGPAVVVGGATAPSGGTLQLLLAVSLKLNVLSGLHEVVPDLVGLDVDMAATAAAADRLADADRLMAGGSSSSSGAGRGGYQYVPSCLLGAVRAAHREGGALSGHTAISWPRAQADCARVAVATRAITRQLLSRDEAALLDHVVEVLVGYGLTYSFTAEEEQQAPSYAAVQQQMARPAPLSPGIDSLHCYSCLGQAVLYVGGSKVSWAAPKPVPLVLRQLLAQMISSANITRLERARNQGEQREPPLSGAATQVPGGAAPAARSGFGPSLAAKKGVLHHKAAAAAAPMPAVGKKASGSKGCWLDALKAKVAPKRKAPPGAAAVKSNKRPATEATDGATAGDVEAAGAAEGSSQGGAAASYDVLYKFNEGYTNAVKRPMKVFEMLQ